MDEKAFLLFCDLDRAGRRAESKVAIRAFLQSIRNDAERDAWARSYLGTLSYFDSGGRFGTQVRQELFDGALWAFLTKGVRSDDPDCLYWLAGLQQNRLSRRQDAPVADHSSISLLKRAFVAKPDRLDFRKALLAVTIETLRHATHEWPSGILDGRDGADLAALDEYDGLIDLARKLGGRETKEMLDAFSVKMQLYRQRLRT
ncbi:MAG: hypothetical protein O9322_00090 [Beijerinckiaceae bacterium]|nr:hypothetical protein [Beijerinckiaceae bacterium]MCZ8301327.1 hypothetical protein [Beijerinckiaceae bacterium]